MNTYTVCFFGHREIDDFLYAEEKIYELVSNLIRTKEYVEFLVGRNGDFDQIVSSVIHKAKRNIFDANSSLTLVLPYLTAEYTDNEKSFGEYYDTVEITDTSDTHAI